MEESISRERAQEIAKKINREMGLELNGSCLADIAEIIWRCVEDSSDELDDD